MRMGKEPVTPKKSNNIHPQKETTYGTDDVIHDLVNHLESVRTKDNIATAKIDQRPDIPRKQPRRLKLPGGEISPCMPSIKDEHIAEGVLKPGEPVAPY